MELEAVRAITDDHIAQLLGSLRASGERHGLLINFGAPKLQIRKFALSDEALSIHARRLLHHAPTPEAFVNPVPLVAKYR